MQIPFKLVAAVENDKRHEQMRLALGKGYPRLKPVEIEDGRSISIACYGPSLADTWKELTRPIISVSGALHYLAERGVIPDYHLDCDPRPHKINHIKPAIDGVHYIMGSCCPPETWDALKHQKVTLVHFYTCDATQNFIAENDPEGLMLRPGSSVGLAALHVAGMLGYRHFEIHGMDGSFKDGKRHAGPHYGHSQGGVAWDAMGQRWQTSRIMSNGCAEMVNTCRMFPIFPVFHGKGLQQALMEEENLENVALAGTAKADVVRKHKVLFIKPLEANGLKPVDAGEIVLDPEAWPSNCFDGLPGHNLPAGRSSGDVGREDTSPQVPA